MKEIIVEGDDEVDLCGTKKKTSKNIFVLSSLVVFAFMLGVLQQQYGLPVWGSPVAHADESARLETVCALKKSFTESSGEGAKQTSFVQDELCGVTTQTGVSVNPTSLEQEITALVAGYPLMDMTATIAKQERPVAAFLVGIAKKESNWGKHAPIKNGGDCYNYWGYKGAGGRGNASGYACFVSKEEAVATVAGRLFTLVRIQHLDTPAKMLVWKCGSSCAGHSPESVRSWIGTVDTYYKKITAPDDRG